MIKGIDISNYQAGLNFSAAKNMGFEICIIKASESTKFTNPKLDEQVTAALNSGMKVGFYHFFKNNGVAEANYFLSKINPYISKMTVKPVIDIESVYSYKEVIDFINTVEEKLSVECVIYCNYSYCTGLRKNSEIAKRALWLAYYGKNDGNYYSAPTDLGFAKFAGQQYSDKNHIGKVNVDMNFFNENILLLDKKNSSSTTKISEKNTAVYYTVVYGDTLSKIATKYKTTTDKLVELNKLKNANLIYVGQILRVR
ncbi:GH25 family lysozyme [Clostridioides difficile]